MRLAFYHLTKKKIYRKRLRQVRPAILPRRIANGKNISHSDILVGNFGLLFKTFRLVRKFSGRSSQICLTIYILINNLNFFQARGIKDTIEWDPAYSFLLFVSSGPRYQTEISKVAYSHLNLVPRVSPLTLQGT